MARATEEWLRYIRRLAGTSNPAQADDAALLERFVAARDEAAFAGLVARHGPMVWHVCRRLLANPSDAEDAFQATFIILAKKADRIRPPEAVGAWLHGVARHVALRAQAAAKSRPLPLTMPAADKRADPLAEVTRREVLAIVDEEVQRLPRAYRLPVILCCLEGQTLEEAASRLGWSIGAVKGRLERGRRRLQTRLVGRGITLSAVLVAVEASRASVPPALVSATSKAAVACATAGMAAILSSSSVLTLAEGVLSTMRWTKRSLIAVVVLVLGLTGTGVALVAGQGPGDVKGPVPGVLEPQRRVRVPVVPPGALRPPLPVPADLAGETPKTLKGLRTARLKAVRLATQTMFEQYVAGRILMSDLYLMSRQLLEAELAVASTKAARLHAYQDQRDRMKKLADVNKARFELGRVSMEDMAAARSWYLEAEIWIVEARQAKDGRATP